MVSECQFWRRCLQNMCIKASNLALQIQFELSIAGLSLMISLFTSLWALFLRLNCAATKLKALSSSLGLEVLSVLLTTCGWSNWFTLDLPKISKVGNSNQPQHFHIFWWKEMLKNEKIIKIGPRLDMPPAVQSFTT